MEVNFLDFTRKRKVHDYLVSESQKKIIKIESRILDEVGVVVEHFDSFKENCGDLKYYFEDDEILEINCLNRVALFVRANGEKLIIENANQKEKDFINLVNNELGTKFCLLKRILISCSLPVEFNAARNELALKEITEKGVTPRIAVSNKITLVCNGPGKINTILGLMKVLEKFRPDLIIDTGTCGSLKTDINIEDIIVSTKAQDFFNTDHKGPDIENKNNKEILSIFPKIELSDYVIASVEKGISDESDRDKLEKYGAHIVNWETSALFSFAQSRSLNFLSIRGVTDMCNEETFNDFKKNSSKVSKKVYNYIKMLCNGI